MEIEERIRELKRELAYLEAQQAQGPGGDYFAQPPSAVPNRPKQNIQNMPYRRQSPQPGGFPQSPPQFMAPRPNQYLRKE